MKHLSYLLISAALVCTGCATNSRDAQELEIQKKLDLAREQYLRKDYESSAITLLPLVRLDDPDAQYSLGYLYYYGLGVPRNVNYGRQLIQAAAEQNNERAVEALVMLARQSAALGQSTSKPPISEDEIIFD